MRALRMDRCPAGCAVLLWGSSWLVPGAKRGDWLSEWRAELWYARRGYAGQGTGRAAWQLLQFCLGAFEDARALRERGEKGAAEAGPVRGSARECVLVLMALLAISLGFGLLLPNVRTRLWPSFTFGAQDLMLIEGTVAAGHGVSTLPRAQYATWAARRQRIFKSFAFYAMRGEVLRGADRGGMVRVAHATSDVFDVVRGGAKSASEHEAGIPKVVVSREMWRALFDGAPERAERTVVIGEQRFAVAGVAPLAASFLPGRPEVWVLDAAAGSRGQERGYVLGRLNPGFHEAEWGDRWSMSAPEPDGFTGDFTCVSLGEALRQPWEVCAFAMLLALLALPATTSLPLGEYRSRTQSGGANGCKADARRWGFLVAKMGLVLGVVYCTAMDLAFAAPRLGANRAEYVQLLASFVLCLWGMRWTLRDQRQRCPVCLGKLTHPARVGQPSWSFLAWNGTELMCAGGHGLLHVPEMPTSWFSEQRWLYLDGSWQVLFAPSHAGVAVR